MSSRTSTLLELGLYPVPGVDCLFTNRTLIVFFYDDDFVILYHQNDKEDFIQFEKALLAKYEIRSLGNLSWFLGNRIIRKDERLHLCQDSYIDKLAKKCNVTSTGPMALLAYPFSLLVARALCSSGLLFFQGENEGPVAGAATQGVRWQGSLGGLGWRGVSCRHFNLVPFVCRGFTGFNII